MKTETLIDKLSENLVPVKRIFPISVTYIGWVFFSFLALFVIIWWRSDNFQMIHLPEYIHEVIPVMFVFFISTFNAIYVSIPGNRNSYILSIAPVFFLLMWMSFLLFRFMFGVSSGLLPYEYHSCVRDFLIMSIPTSFFLVFIIRKRYPTLNSNLGFWIFAASATISALGETLLCPNEDASHLLLVHMLPVFGLCLFGKGIGNIIFFREFRSLK